MLQIEHCMFPEYVITTNDVMVLCKDKSIKECNTTNKEGMCLAEAWLLDKTLRKILEDWVFAIVFPDKEIADRALANLLPRLKEYFGRTDWKVAKLETIHRLETEQEYPIYGDN